MPKKKNKKKQPDNSISPTAQVFLALSVFVLSILFTRGEQLDSVEVGIFNAIYSLPSFLEPLFYAITQFGSIYVLGVLVILYFAKQHYHIVIRLLMTGTLAFLLAGFAKSVWGRARPHELLPNITTLDVFHGAGFPSGHVALATALAFTVAHYVPTRYYWLPITWIVGVALSRVYLGVHLPLDLIGGFAIGWLSYALFRHVRLYDIRHRTKRKLAS